MKKKIIFSIFAIFLLFFIANTAVNAETESFESLSIDITIDNNGTAYVTEIWDVEVYYGTELYKTYYDMETSEIQNLSVTDEEGTMYETLSSWDINLSQDEKAGKCGINIVSDGYEICFGIGEYGEHVYTITYEITNFVSNYNDEYDLTYFTLVPQNMDPSPESVTITISAEGLEFTDDNVTATGSGFTGSTSIEDRKSSYKNFIYTSNNSIYYNQNGV